MTKEELIKRVKECRRATKHEFVFFPANANLKDESNAELRAMLAFYSDKVVFRHGRAERI